RRGHEVVITCAGAPPSIRRGHVTVADPDTALQGVYDVAISNNFARAFDGVNAPTKIVWTHNPGFSQAHIKADAVAKWRHRPHLVHLSKYTQSRSWFLPRAGQTIIRHGMPAELLAKRSERRQAGAPVAVFASYPGRNLRKVIAAWRDVVHPKVPQARLVIAAEVEAKHLAGVPASELGRLNIDVVGVLGWSELMDLMRTARVFVAPGHFQETYNLLSVEAAACGVPTVTMGIGALRERVSHDVNGWIAGSTAAMGVAIARVLADDELWLRYHRASLVHPDLVSWEERAAEWEAYIAQLSRAG
ncbi:MAG: glycosyltransferase, partial [Hyphomicrobium sp.]